MAELFEREILRDWGGSGLQEPSTPLWLSCRSSLFHTLFQYYRSPLERDRQRSSAWRTGTEVAVRCYMAVQLLALLVLVQTDRSQWGEFRWVLQTAAFARLDHLAAEFGLESAFFLLTASVIATANLSFAYMLLCFSVDLKFGLSLARKAFSLSTDYLKGAGLVPSLCILLAVLKYSLVPSLTVREYLDYPASTFNYGSGGAIAASIALAGCWIVALHVSVVYESAQSLEKWLCSARAHSRVELCLYALLTLIVTLLFSAQSEW